MNTANVSKCQSLAAFSRKLGFECKASRHGHRTSYTFKNDHVSFHLHTLSFEGRILASVKGINGYFRGSHFEGSITTPAQNASIAKFMCNLNQEDVYVLIEQNSHKV